MQSNAERKYQLRWISVLHSQVLCGVCEAMLFLWADNQGHLENECIKRGCFKFFLIWKTLGAWVVSAI